MNYNRQNYMLMIFKNLANANRLKILELIISHSENSKSNEISVSKIENLLDTSQSNISNHLIKMRDAGILRARQDRANMYYSLRDEKIKQIFRQI